jgi:hypothetical protein
MVGAYLSAFRIPATVIEARPNSALHRLDHFLVFHFDAVQSRSDAALAERRVPHVGVKRDFGASG